jgi:hypothetical protein
MGQNVERRFDDLAKALAKGHTRKGALKAGLVSVGAAVAAAMPGRARADQPQGNDACAHFCSMVFPPGPARGECISQAAHGEGICFGCGPGTPTPTVLCVDVCCNAGEVCCNQHCVSPVCSGGHVFSTTTCTCVCPPTLPTECNGVCKNTTTDPTNCGTCGHVCPTGAACVNSQCVCPPNTEVCNNACVPVCPDGQQHNPTTCVCECPTGQTFCQGLCRPNCPDGQSMDPTTCACVCGAGQTVCGQTCCQPGQACVGGSCVCVGGNPCQSNADCFCGECIGGICSLQACQGKGTCGNFGQCGGATNQNCQCYTTAEIAGVCGCNTTCSGIQACTSTSNCPSGSICVVNTCCGAAGVCVRICTPGTCAPLGIANVLGALDAVSSGTTAG